jgi:type IV pilus assembly protein PilO
MDSSDRNKYLLLAIVVVGALGYFGHQYVYLPKSQEIAVMESRLNALQAQNRSARMLVDGEGQTEVERKLAAYRDQLQSVEGLIPLSEEVPELLDAISIEAQRTGVELSLIQPTGAVAEEYYTRRTYSLGVIGSYHQIGDFLTRIASLPRIVTPSALSLQARGEETRTGEPKLEAKFTIETYVLPTEQDTSHVAKAD